MPNPSTCKARYQPGNTYRCERCDLTWDSDETAPECLDEHELMQVAVMKTLSDKAPAPLRLKDIKYNNTNLIISFNHGRFEGASMPATASVQDVVDQLRSLASKIERNVK